MPSVNMKPGWRSPRHYSSRHRRFLRVCFEEQQASPLSSWAPHDDRDRPRQAERGPATSFQGREWPSKPASCAITASTAPTAGTTSAKACAFAAARKRSLISTGRCRLASITPRTFYTRCPTMYPLSKVLSPSLFPSSCTRPSEQSSKLARPSSSSAPAPSACSPAPSQNPWAPRASAPSTSTRAASNGFAQQTHQLPLADKAKTSEDQLRRARENAGIALSEFDVQDGFDVVFECTGAEPCIQMSIHSAITGVKVMLIGMGARNVTLPLSAAATREVNILGSFRYAHTYPKALQLLSAGKLKNVDKLVTHRFHNYRLGWLQHFLL
ncbi:hypothetical protein OE88DRAFT_1046525 [Heliocybe sulcata]|uniref:Alcohol dehydrogenase-like C-terminal domain-containing protein n=1 Tax=Heliocybe sulcata TaxID=5364 RepID=A0A5C3MPD8_9AGAM|nr:hypothetical protein OE88DRAFT_1046525 [Heliocybe sulcata]